MAASGNPASSGNGWAVVDVETTGLHPARHRIIEIAAIRLGEDVEPIDEWSTLVDPETTSLGSNVHGIRASELTRAPRFGNLVPELLARLSGRVIVAHNAVFDVAFLQAETVRAGIAWGPVEGLCTMDALRKLGLSKSRNLHSCSELGVAAGQGHVALDDARAVAGLMAYLAPYLWTLDSPAAAPAWPPAEVLAPVLQRVLVSAGKATQDLTQHLSVPPGLGITAAAGSTYMGLLDLIVQDGKVTDDEVDALSLFAHACGITRDVARQVHLAYLQEMSRVARADGIVTSEERAYLMNLTTLLTRALPH